VVLGVQVKIHSTSLGVWRPTTLHLFHTAVTPVSENRTNIKRNSTPLRTVISTPEFVKHFGEAKADPKGSRRNIFGLDDELKVAPKGVNKTHKCVVLAFGKPNPCV
jgi:hypothetical protein